MAGETLQTWQVSEPYINLHCLLGEGPYYEEATNSLRFVDIKKNRLHSVSLDEGPASLATLELDVPIGVTADIEGHDPREKLLVGLKYGLAVLDRKSGKYEYITRFSDSGDNVRIRSNDGAVDPHGRFWLGTMTDFTYDLLPEGTLSLFDKGKTLAVVRENVRIPNSVGWSPDHRTMYFTDTLAAKVFAWDYSPTNGSLSNERVFYHHKGPGGPDGFRIDVEGNMWHAIYGESRVIKISPEGVLVGEIKLPTKNITCPEFVGTELYITTAADEDPLSGPESKEFGGGLYRVDVGVTGLKPFEFKLAA